MRISFDLYTLNYARLHDLVVASICKPCSFYVCGKDFPGLPDARLARNSTSHTIGMVKVSSDEEYVASLTEEAASVLQPQSIIS